MSLSKTQIDAVTGAYSLARKSGILNTAWGRKLFSTSYFLYKRYWEDSLAALIKRRPEMFSGGTVLDIGANIGYTAALLGGAIEPWYKVYAFEPEPSNFSFLKDVAGEKKFGGRIVPVQAAVGAHDGTIELWQNENHHADHRIATDSLRQSKGDLQSVSVPIVKIDTFCRERGIEEPIRFIKIDVQGYEVAVFEGMEQTVAAYPNAAITVEYMPEALESLGFAPGSLLEWLKARGFLIYRLQDDGSVQPGAPEKLEAHDYVDLVCSRTALE